VLEGWKDMFYPGGVETDLDVIDADKADRERIRALKREARYERRRGMDIFDMLLVVPYMLFPPNEVMASFRKAREKAEAAEQERVRENVDAWVKQVASAYRLLTSV